MTDAVLPQEASRYEQLRKLTEISRALTYTTSIDQVLRLATTRAAELLNGVRALLMLLDPEGLLEVSAAYGIEDDAIRRFREPLDETLGRRVQTLLGVGEGESFIGVPLVANGAVKGLLGIVRPGGEPCTEEEEWLLSAVADQVAVALENSRLEGEVNRAREQAKHIEQAEDAGEAKDRALATLSHDLRSPLNAIDSYAELMEMEILGPLTDRQREALGRIRMGGRHLLGVLQNVLEMARIEAGALKVEATSVALDSVVEEALSIVRHTASARNQELSASGSDRVVVRGDPDRLRQVLINLVGNAIKYTPPEGRVQIRTSILERDGATWGEVAITDDGPGIPEEQLETIFQPYVRLQQGNEHSTEGAGLGLAISRELVRQMGGDVEVRSIVGDGSVFFVRVPIASENGDTPPPTSDSKLTTEPYPPS